ncbi:Uncharacterized protein ABJ99_0121 [Pseudomonas syringae pv. cilantro]|uniref:Uncharacterized protein n=2 Tax=Pseudomonas syringae group TaxID=136849 RepID=A0A0N1JNA4_PSESX|nr:MULTISPECIES: hypothetical protein [Pseudomonas syringae group]KPC27625.1 Uncharacterized protein ABJ99_0121 [Pseudomonas syringae pv. cilantro]KPW81226.1 Uncharacterized protein ALO76_01888 [Pseudomonas syringae pv. coriandricola]RMN12047.1 hypothetical protein ALQ65_04232 [Pseudomonas syringae pv. coriandricola]
MLSILYPKVPWIVRQLTIGLMPFTAKADSIPKLIVKATKETILAAKVRKCFSIYLIPYDVDGFQSLGFVAAFFDDNQHPILVGGAFIKQFHARQLAALFLSPQVDVHFFDELGREMLGYRAEFKFTKKHRDMLMSAVFPSLEDIHQGRVLNAISDWFHHSGPKDDAEAIKVDLKYSVIPEDMLIIDAMPENHAFHGSKGYSLVTLEREEPGDFQEKEIIVLLRRSFESCDIYHSPLRTYDNEEISDVLVVSDSSVLIVQAKDSPNIERIINNTIERKRKTTNGALKKGMAQVKGAISYIRRTSPVIIKLGGKEVAISLEGKKLYGLIVVKELFSDDYDEYTPPMLEVYEATGVPCITLSYNELHQYTRHLGGEEVFMEAFMKVFDHGLKTGVFPRLRVHAPGAMGS